MSSFCKVFCRKYHLFQHKITIFIPKINYFTQKTPFSRGSPFVFKRFVYTRHIFFSLLQICYIKSVGVLVLIKMYTMHYAHLLRVAVWWMMEILNRWNTASFTYIINAVYTFIPGKKISIFSDQYKPKRNKSFNSSELCLSHYTLSRKLNDINVTWYTLSLSIESITEQLVSAVNMMDTGRVNAWPGQEYLCKFTFE